MDTPAIVNLSQLIRYYVLKMTASAESGHPTSCFSAADLITVLFFKYLRADLDNFESPVNDRVIFSKGHASALFYSLYGAAGNLTEEDLMGYRTFNSTLEGHPTRRFPFTEAATGSLGQGLSIGAGEAWALKKVVAEVSQSQPSFWQTSQRVRPESTDTGQEDPGQARMTNIAPKVYVLLGDGELAEGSVWEAANWAAFKKLNNLVAICDINRFGQAEETMWQHNLAIYERRFNAFGWSTIVIDGHDYQQIDTAYQKALQATDAPVAIIAKTIKGKGIAYWEDKPHWHNKMLPKVEFDKAVAELSKGMDKNLRGVVQKPEINSTSFWQASQRARPESRGDAGPSSATRYGRAQQASMTNNNLINYNSADLVPTKKAFGNALERLGNDSSQLLVLDGDVSNSLHTDQFQKKYPERFLQMYIAEQNMVGVAVGLARRGYLPFVTTFSAFMTRAHDQIRMAALSGVTVLFNGSYGGVSMGKDGPSQMGLEDLSLFRSVEGSIVLYPSDPFQTERLVEQMLLSSKHTTYNSQPTTIYYMRTTREPTPVIYKPGNEFPVGGSKTFEVDKSFWQANQRARPESKTDPGPSSATRYGRAQQARMTIMSKKFTATIVAAGITVHEALKAQKQLSVEGISVRVIDCYSVKPIDAEALKKASTDSRAVIVVEDHYPEGGLGEAVKSALADDPKVPIIHLAVYKTPKSGTPEELLAYEEIDAEAIIRVVKKLASKGDALRS